MVDGSSPLGFSRRDVVTRGSVAVLYWAAEMLPGVTGPIASTPDLDRGDGSFCLGARSW